MIYAHAQTGMFGPLFNTRVGERAVIRRPDAPDLNYLISEYDPRWPINDLSVLEPLPREQLVLAMCTSWHLNDPRPLMIADPA